MTTARKRIAAYLLIPGDVVISEGRAYRLTDVRHVPHDRSSASALIQVAGVRLDGAHARLERHLAPEDEVTLAGSADMPQPPKPGPDGVLRLLALALLVIALSAVQAASRGSRLAAVDQMSQVREGSS